jgi:hypothetical protein
MSAVRLLTIASSSWFRVIQTYESLAYLETCERKEEAYRKLAPRAKCRLCSSILRLGLRFRYSEGRADLENCASFFFRFEKCSVQEVP